MVRPFAWSWLIVAFAAACGSSGSDASPAAPGPTGPGGADAGGDAATAPPGDAGPYHPLSMNDVTVLTPLPASTSKPVLMRGADPTDEGTALIGRAQFDQLVDAAGGVPIVFPEAYDRLHVVAVRFDLCDRNAPGPCAADAEGRLRLVVQPLSDSGAEDVGLHAFFALPAAEVPDVVGKLRELARSRGAQDSGPLDVSPALRGPTADAEAYAAKLGAILRRYAIASRLVRLTLNAQPAGFAQIRWIFRGIERKGATFAPIDIAGGGGTQLDVILEGAASYSVTPAADAPAGIMSALSKTAMDAATPARRRELLDVLAAVDNPLLHAPDTTPCVSCHASTVVLAARSTEQSVDRTTLSSWFSSGRDTSIANGKSAKTDRTLRALGYIGKEPMITQRVANDTAQVLSELDARFPR